MKKYDYTGKTVFIGIDVHKRNYFVTAVVEGEMVKRDGMRARPEKLLAYIRKFFPGAVIHSAYEAGFSGFGLHRYLLENGINNIVVHAASIEVSSRDRVKTDKRDATKIAQNSILTRHIDDNQITNAHMADDAIDSAEIADGAVDTVHIADLNVTTAKIANNAITAAKLPDNVITATHIPNDLIDSDHYAAGSIDNEHLADDADDREYNSNGDYVDSAKDGAHEFQGHFTFNDQDRISSIEIDGLPGLHISPINWEVVSRFSELQVLFLSDLECQSIK